MTFTTAVIVFCIFTISTSANFSDKKHSDRDLFSDSPNNLKIVGEIKKVATKKLFGEPTKIDKHLLKKLNKDDGLVKTNTTFDLFKYHTHNEINDFLRELPQKYPNKVRVGSIGRSFEGREMLYVQIGYPVKIEIEFSNEKRAVKKHSSSSTSSSEERRHMNKMKLRNRDNEVKKRTQSELPKQAVWLDAGIHAREWIAPATALNVINELLSNPAHDSILKTIDFFVLPSMNPDGYEYSRSVDKWWRRTRSVRPNSTCVGVDGNRNFAFRYEITNQNDTECGETYSGPNAFSEPETRNLMEFLSKRKGHLMAYLTLHSLGNMILSAYSNEDRAQIEYAATQIQSAIKAANGPEFDIYMLNAAGTGFSYMKQLGGFKYSFLLELTDGDPYGFWPPESVIEKEAKEVIPGIVKLAQICAKESKMFLPK